MNIGNLPSDPMILMSYVNTMLRDSYGSLDELCEDKGIARPELESALARAGFEYNEAQNRFW
ncbi:MAG: DUF4250 domain-containing protein [Candidatus Cryptobacteroides sp.]